jgi:hypothetical protein
VARHVTREQLKRCGLAIAVLVEIDVEPADDGLVVLGTPPVLVDWRSCRRALAGFDPESHEGRTRLARWLLRRRWVADHCYDDLAERARPIGLPVDHVLHPGLDWVRTRVLGDVLDLGLGFVGLQPGQPDRVILVPQGVLDACDLDGGQFWLRARSYLERMGELAAERWHRDRSAVVRPMGDCDVVTLLGSATFRTAIVGGNGGGMRPVVVPMRTRGWLDVSRIDPAFGPAAAAATEPVDRGFVRPLLVTVDEVAMVPEGGRPQVALDDEVRDDDWVRPVLYR